VYNTKAEQQKCVTMQVPVVKGPLEVRYFPDGGHVASGVSSPMTVNVLKVLLRVPGRVTVGGDLRVCWKVDGPVGDKDWIGLYPVGVSSSLLALAYVYNTKAEQQKCVTMQVPVVKGPLEVRYFPDGGHVASGVSSPITVG
jgi:hypothetical protein